MSEPERRRRPRLIRSARRIREEVEEEIRFHLEMRVAALERGGLDPAAAREEALRMFGDVEKVRAECVRIDTRRERHMRRKEQLAEIRQDLVHGIRQLRRRPGFTAVSIVTLAVGIGATTAVFSAADHVLLRPLPYGESDRVVTLWESKPAAGVGKVEVSPGNFLDWRERSGSFEAMGLVEPFGFDLTGDGPPVAVPVWLVSEGYFEALGVRPFLGRAFLPREYLRPAASDQDDAYGQGESVVLISHRLWRTRYGSDPAIVGRTIQLDNIGFTVVGVLPPNLEYPEAKDIWAPKWFREGESQDRTSSYLSAVARLRPGVSVAAAQADLDRVAATLAAEYPRTNQNTGALVVPLEEQILGPVRPALLVLLGAVAFVLLIACANIASLLLARGYERERELGVRAALGARRARLVRQLITESALLAVLGGAAGLLLARLGVAAFAALSPPELPRLSTISIDGPVLIFAFLVTVAAAVLFGLLPALRFSRPDIRSALGSSGRSVTAGRERTRLRAALVVGEIAMALILLIGAGLLVRSFVDILSNDPGFATGNRAALQLFLWDRNPTAEARLQRAQEIKERLAATPGVEAVGIVTSLPFHPSRINAQGRLVIEGRPEPPPGQETRVFATIASEDYFQVMGVPLKRGRPFMAEDRADAPAVAIINESLARRYFRGEDPIGKRVTIGVMSRPASREIIGVVGDVRPTTLDSEPQPELFIPLTQSGSGSLTFVARTSTEATRLLPTLRYQIWQIDPGQAIYHAATVEQLISDTLIERRFHLVLLACFSLIALVLASVGVYGLISYSASQRTNEIGVRVAMGARGSDVVGMIVREAARLAMPGIVLGVGGALLLTRFMEHMLYGVRPTDLLTFLQIAALMLMVSLVAAFVPARRASRVEPMRVLRYE